RADAARSYLTAAAAFDRARVLAQTEATRIQTAPAPPAQTTPPTPPPTVTPPQPEPQPSVTNPAPPPTVSPALPPAPTQDPQRADRDAINGVLNDYEAAWSTLDANAVRRIQPQAPPDLNRTFDSYRSLALQLQNRQITMRGDTATVICERITT